MDIIGRLGRDSLVSSVLILYGLHPEDLETRVAKAVDRIRPQLRKQGCEVELLGVNEGVIRLRVQTGSHTCGSTAKTVQATLEGAIYDAAPDMSSLVIEGFEEKPDCITDVEQFTQPSSWCRVAGDGFTLGFSRRTTGDAPGTTDRMSATIQIDI
jgi:Fe-S cluster biogenesis protein NfuA